ncbi:MAG: M20/M25/M40 family metallo-hydrolase [Acidobacteriota bacterium]
MIRSRQTPQSVFDRATALLLDLVNISSPSGDVEGLDAACSRLGEALRNVGWTATVRRETDDAGHALPVLEAFLGDAPTGGGLLAIGHLDTVLDAAEPDTRDGRLWATGSVDMKAGLVAFVAALELVAERGAAPPADLRLVVVPDEEVAGAVSHAAMRRAGDARGLWCLEPGSRRGEAETIVLGRRGMVHYALDVEGRSAHAGNGYWDGRSALAAAAEWCVGAQNLARRDGPTVSVARLVAGEADFVERLAECADLLGSSRQINVVPDRARAEGEARFLNPADGRALREAMERLRQELAARHQVTMQLVFDHGVAPLDPQPASRRWAELAITAAAARGWSLEAEEERAGISFPNFLPDPSVMPILDGLGPTGGGMHTRDEFVDLDSFDRRITLLADLMERLEA